MKPPKKYSYYWFSTPEFTVELGVDSFNEQDGGVIKDAANRVRFLKGQTFFGVLAYYRRLFGKDKVKYEQLPQ